MIFLIVATTGTRLDFFVNCTRVPKFSYCLARSTSIHTTTTHMVLLERCALRLKNDFRRLVRHILFAPDPLVAALRLGWLALIVWGEIGVFVYALAGCNWPVPAAVHINKVLRFFSHCQRDIPS